AVGCWIASLLAPAGPVKDQPSSPTPTANDEIIKLSLAGMDETVLLAKVAATEKSKFDTSADALLKLKSAGVSQRVIAAILGGPSTPSAQTSSPSSTFGGRRPLSGPAAGPAPAPRV